MLMLPRFSRRSLPDVLRDEIGRCVHVYLDDVLVFTRKDFAHHLDDASTGS